VIRCTTCGLIRRNLIFPKSQLQQIFSQAYFFEDQKNYFAGCFQPHKLPPDRKKDFLHRLKQLQTHLTRSLSFPKKILDIGCATGFFLHLAKTKGWQVQGVEISPLAASFAKKYFHLPVFIGTLEDAHFLPRSFPVITCWEVLPYIENPGRFLKTIYRLLPPGGLFALQLTVVDSLLHYLANLSYYLSGGKFKFIAAKGYPYQNAYHFTRASTRAFLSRFNFRILQEENIEIDYRLSALPQKFLPLLQFISLGSRLTGKTIQYRVIAQKPV